jgi:hypothetical protein
MNTTKQQSYFFALLAIACYSFGVEAFVGKSILVKKIEVSTRLGIGTEILYSGLFYLINLEERNGKNAEKSSSVYPSLSLSLSLLITPRQ